MTNIFREDELEPVNCEECGSDNVLTAPTTCKSCREWRKKLRLHRVEEITASLGRISANVRLRQDEIDKYRRTLDLMEGDSHYATEIQQVIDLLEGFNRDDEDRLTDLTIELEDQ